MDWQYTLIHLFLHVCEQYQRRLCVVAQRLSNNHAPAFSDEEVLTVYLFGLMQQRRTLTDIYAYTRDHLMAFFPRLPSYVAFVQRPGRLADAFPLLVEAALQACPRQSSGERPAERSGEPTDYIIDSFPVVMAQQKRSAWARGRSAHRRQRLLRLEEPVFLRRQGTYRRTAASRHDAAAALHRAGSRPGQ
ncbi:MAG: hypothetical protein KatS3mg043_1440 [Rhodothermaceae bacterium]|nr:MAG: hypothetical protein KatS3mg043_1440 [Rhodothermaceae bacterium]